MELPYRAGGDELLKPGELTAIRRRLRTLAPQHDLTTVIACAFDHRTRMLPFIFADTRMVPAGVRTVGSAMVDSGFTKTRIVLQQWNRNFRPSQMRLDGRIPDMFMVSSMQLHSAPCVKMIRDACRIPPAHRPLIIAGGPKVVYEPWEVFSADAADPWGADVAVTGEAYVLLSMLEAVLSQKSPKESIREAFGRARDSGALDGIPGLVFAPGSRNGTAAELIDTGIQRLAGDLDELPDPVLGYGLIERPSWRATLDSLALPAGEVLKYGPVGSIVLTLGCRFTCPYCPIPAYNQRQYRTKSGQRIAEDMSRLYSEYGMRFFLGADDNFFNDPARALDIVETMARTEIDGVNFRHRIRWGTEVTVHDTLRMTEHLRMIRRAGLRALWIGVEDMTGTLVKKGQSVDKTTEAFRMLRERGIIPMPMMMHHDSQPLYTPGKPDGLLNQVKMLRKAGAISMQVLMITPAPGSKLYEETYTSGMVLESIGKRRAEIRMFDGNYVVASTHGRPWRKQLNILVAYIYFYNPLRLLVAMFRVTGRQYLADVGAQIFGMLGLAMTIRRTLGWTVRLMFGKIKRCSQVPASRVPIRSVDGGPASHALPATPPPQPAESKDSTCAVSSQD